MRHTIGTLEAREIRFYRGPRGVLLIWRLSSNERSGTDLADTDHTTRRCNPLRTSAPGTTSLCATADLMASLSGRVS